MSWKNFGMGSKMAVIFLVAYLVLTGLGTLCTLNGGDLSCLILWAPHLVIVAIFSAIFDGGFGSTLANIIFAALVYTILGYIIGGLIGKSKKYKSLGSTKMVGRVPIKRKARNR